MLCLQDLASASGLEQILDVEHIRKLLTGGTTSAEQAATCNRYSSIKQLPVLPEGSNHMVCMPPGWPGSCRSQYNALDGRGYRPLPSDWCA